MASSVVDKEEIEVGEKGNQVDNLENKDEVVSVELPAPDGWKKKFIPKKSSTPKRNEIVFISPTGEEIKNKKALDLFLKAHPGGPPPSEFDWGTGDTPRRSARISEKSKATESPENEPGKKRERKSSSKKGAKEDSDDGDDEAPKEEQAAEELKESTDVEMNEAEDGGDKIAEQDAKDENKDTVETMKAAEDDPEDKNEESILKKNTESTENPEEANNKNDSDLKGGQAENNSLPQEAAEEERKSEVPPPLSGSNEVASAEQEVKVAKESSEKEATAGDEASSEKVTASLPDESKPQETRHINGEEAQHQPKASPVSCRNP